MSAQYISDEQFKLVQESAATNLTAWMNSDVVKTLKYFSAEDADVWALCRAHHGTIVKTADAEIGVNLPPLSNCSSPRCRCYFRPCNISIECDLLTSAAATSSAAAQSSSRS